MNRRAILFAGLMFWLIIGPLSAAGIKDTPHNLSTSGSGGVKATVEDRICVFCHTPHNSTPSGPLWNRQNPGQNYIPYNSSTVQASPGQPTGSSLLCLGCHDGTIALGKVLSSQTILEMQGGVTTMPVGEDRLGTDLRDDHPISFTYDAQLFSQNPQLADPSSLTGAVKLDRNEQLQCTSCHDAHNNDQGKFLVMSNLRGALCITCHKKPQWSQSAHSQSNANWDGSVTDPWPFTSWTTVADNACQNCHQPHSVGSPERLLNYSQEENNCTACHNGHVAQKNIEAEFNKISRHPIGLTQGVHDPAETAVVNSRHVECFDCHNPHAARSGASGPTGALAGVRGVNTSNSEVNPISFEYQLCFRCHGDSNNKPPALTPRQIDQTNVRLEFNTANPSFHPVTGAGRNNNVPSLISPLNTGSTIKCSDCHNNNAGPGAGGSGPNGPHGSTNSTLLERRYVTTDFTSESPSNYALCYKCHDRNSILGDQSFTLHNKHIVGERAPCNACHDPHGISITQGTLTNNTHLINFDTSIVSAAGMGGGGMGGGGGGPTFTDNGQFAGSCTLSCHGQNHMNFSYPGGGGMH